MNISGFFISIQRILIILYFTKGIFLEKAEGTNKKNLENPDDSVAKSVDVCRAYDLRGCLTH